MYSLHPVTMDIEALDTDTMERQSVHSADRDRQSSDVKEGDRQPMERAITAETVESSDSEESSIHVVSCLVFFRVYTTAVDLATDIIP